MSNTVIKVENISKQYRLGEVGTGSLSHDVNRWWHKVRGKEDPYLKIGDSNDRTQKGNSEYVWALKNINFEVKQGEVLGIIGRNGAGKSTLLKILSRTTTPTTGSIKIKGRVASLLEVGTGFHPELSGRDNIYLNGAILGMSKQEITKKFDEIVDFAGVERYIDTPVKRYSSGMYVRLAFGVAAHLEPEILIVDEVLAVGDADFQEKCLGKMQAISTNEGRTVLFVSHNMPAVKSLCNNVVLLENGQKTFEGLTEQGLQKYASANKKTIQSISYAVYNLFQIQQDLDATIKYVAFEIQDTKGQLIESIKTGQVITCKIYYKILNTSINFEKTHFSISFKNMNGDTICVLQSYIKQGFFTQSVIASSETITVIIPCFPLIKGTYTISIDIVNQLNWSFFDQQEDILTINVEEGALAHNKYPIQQGVVATDADWFLS